MNPSTAYERFTQEIYQQLVNLDVVRTTEVQHNIKLEGRSGQKHQIDVYWEYEIAGNKHKVAIECKNYNKPVPISAVRNFKGVLDDLNGVNGIMVTKVGYQEGAKLYAKEYGISLKELRTPGYGETIIGTIESHYHIEMRRTLFLIDEDWAAKNNFNLQKYRKYYATIDFTNARYWLTATHLPLSTTDNIIRDEKGNIITSLDELERQIPDHPTEDFPFVFKFDDAYLENQHFGPVKIQEVMYSYEIKDETKTLSLDAGELVRAILKDTLCDKTDYIALH